MRKRPCASILLTVFAVAGGGTSCLPADTRPPPGSIFLAVTSDDQPEVMTADGWSLSIDRLLVGIGEASLGSGCIHYAEANYLRLLDARLPQEQKLSVLYGLGRCDFDFQVSWPVDDTLLGEGVNESDKELMRGGAPPMPGKFPDGISVDLAATARRGEEVKRVHLMFRQPTTYNTCLHTMPGAPSQKFDLNRNANFVLHIGVRGATLFSDDGNPATATLRFDPFAIADSEYGDDDGEVTLEELDRISLQTARQWGPYGGSPSPTSPGSLRDYLHLALLRGIIAIREDTTCAPIIGFD